MTADPLEGPRPPAARLPGLDSSPSGGGRVAGGVSPNGGGATRMAGGASPSAEDDSAPS